MRSDFDNAPRIYAFPVSELGNLAELVGTYGAELPDTPKDPASPTTRCLCGGLDREGSDDLRALKLGTTATTIPLTDGRHAFLGYWTLAAVEAVQSGNIEAEEKSPEQFAALRPAPEI